MEPSLAILIGAVFATLGWLYTARRSRVLARKQHTINILLQTSFNKEFGDSFRTVADMLAKPCPDLTQPDLKEEWYHYIRMMNYYEFTAVGIRYGDLDERLIRESHRTNTIKPFEWSHS
jgi:hypothetical protein